MAAAVRDTAPRERVRFLLEDRAWTGPLKSKQVTSDLFELDFDPAKTASSRFKAFVREGAHDAGELAIVTLLQAIHYGKPLVLLPLVVFGSFHHKSISYNADKGEITPGGMEGRRFGVRTYSQTTGVWARAILQHDYGTDLGKVTWVTYDDAHLAEHTDPPNCERAPGGPKTMIPALMAGEIDGALAGRSTMPPDDPRIRFVIPDPDAAATAWEEKYGCRPINHMLVVTKDLCDRRPDVVRALYRTMLRQRTAGEYPFPAGFDDDWTALRLISRYAVEQGVVGRAFTPDELFADARRVLGA